MNIHEFDWQQSYTSQILTAVADGFRAVRETGDDGLIQAEHCEELAGIAFVALQRYLASADASFRLVFGTVAEEDHELRRQDCPSVHGVPIVEAIWAAANYWKHHGEWPDWEPVGHRRHTIRALALLDVSRETEFPCLVLLERLSGDGSDALSTLLDAASSWREAVFNRLHLLKSD
jgi:hypothetical protein